MLLTHPLLVWVRCSQLRCQFHANFCMPLAFSDLSLYHREVVQVFCFLTVPHSFFYSRLIYYKYSHLCCPITRTPILISWVYLFESIVSFLIFLSDFATECQPKICFLIVGIESDCLFSILHGKTIIFELDVSKWSIWEVNSEFVFREISSSLSRLNTFCVKVDCCFKSSSFQSVVALIFETLSDF